VAIKAGQMVMTKDGFIIDRIQTGGVSSVGIPEEQIMELGNYNTLTTIRDIPDLSFDIDSYDVSCKMEALLQGIDPTTVTSGQAFNFALNVPFNVLSPFRSAQNYFNTIRGLVVPHLFLESVAYKFGVKQNASQTYSLKGDSVFFVPGNPQEDTFTSNGTTQTYTLSHTAVEYFNNTLGANQYVLNMSVYNTDGTFDRLFNGVNFDYTDTATSFTFNTPANVPPTGSVIRVQYGTTFVESVTQAQNNADGIQVSPAAIKAKDIDVYVGSTAATPVFTRWTGVQSFDCTWKVNLDANQEFGNPLDVSMDFVTPDVTGTITTRDVSVTELFQKIAQATNVPANQVAGTLSSTPVPVEIRLSNPDTGAPLKTLYVPDARFEPPATQGRVNQKLDTPFKFMSDTGQFYVYDGQRPGSSWTDSTPPGFGQDG
jgi:hypothetical protein